jgi:serine/threonine-protein kinase HipA
MNDLDISQYQPADTLYLWWLGQPSQPQLVGTLATVRAMKGVSLRYAASWRAAGFALSEDLPLIDAEFLPVESETAAGAVDDARPDRWGERVFRFLDKPPRLSVMEFLLYAGDARFGALGVSVSKERYVGRSLGPLPELADVPAIAQLVRRVLDGEPIEAAQQRLIAPGGTLGGARPKALQVGHALAVKRFDRVAGRRTHALSAKVALKAAGDRMGYPELAQILRRRGASSGGLHLQHMRELFRRMVFNILMDNTDDHEKNHVLLMNDRGEYELSPAFDVLPSGQALGYQQMRVGTQEADATLENALSEARLFGLKPSQAIDEVKGVVADWGAHFARIGVSPANIASLAAQIDRPFLAKQRAEFA